MLTPDQMPEQDALIGQREYTVSGLLTLFPFCSRAFHAGFTGYNHAHSGGGMEALGGGMMAQYEKLSSMMGDWAEMKELAKEFNDVVP